MGKSPVRCDVRGNLPEGVRKPRHQRKTCSVGQHEDSRSHAVWVSRNCSRFTQQTSQRREVEGQGYTRPDLGKNPGRPFNTFVDNWLEMALSKPILVLGDSRGDGLQEKLDETEPNQFVVRFVASAGLVMATTKFLSEIIKMKPDYVVVIAGICKVTLKNNVTKRYTVRFSNANDSVESYVETMNEVKNLIYDVSSNTKVIFNRVTGVDLEDYNSKARTGLTGDDLKHYHENKPAHPMQNLLNETVIKINQRIAKFNYTNNVATPWTATFVHKHEKGDRYYHHYQHLADGCHLLEEAKVFWAEKLQKATTKSDGFMGDWQWAV